MEYNLRRTCKDCEHVDAFELTKVEAAFELFNVQEILDAPCSNCGSKNCASFGHQHPQLDQELLDLWGNDEGLYLMAQDEELLLAEHAYFPLLLKAIDEGKYLKAKLDVLVEAVCVLLYDNTIASDEFSPEENIEREEIAAKVRPELTKRKAKILAVGDVVMGYVQTVVYPQIGL